MFLKLFLGITATLFIFGTGIPAQASCGSGSCPHDTGSWAQTEEGEVRLSYQFDYSDQDEHRIGTRAGAFREIRGHHDEEYTVSRVHRLSAAVGLNDWLTMELRAPFVSRSHSHIHRHGGADILDQWDFSGIGDLSILTRACVFKPTHPKQPVVSLIVGGELPTGSHHEKGVGSGVAELGVQPGSGSLDAILGFSTLQKFTARMLGGGYGTLPVFTSVIGQLNGPGDDEYRLGDTLQINIGMSYPITHSTGLLTQLNFLLRDRDGKGTTGEEIQKTGGEALYFSPGLEFRPHDDWRLFTTVQIPIYERVNLIQTVSDYNVLFGLSYRFQAWKSTRASLD